MKKESRNYILGGIGVLLIVTAAFFLAPAKSLPTVPLSELEWEIEPNLIIVEFPNNPNISFTSYRANDAEPMKFFGRWRHSFIGPSEFLAYGFTTSTPNKQHLLGVTPKPLHQINISKLPGRIDTILVSPNGNETLLSGLTNPDENNEQLFYSCLSDTFIEVTPSNEVTISDCKDIKNEILPEEYRVENAAYQSFWSNSNENELLIRKIVGTSTQLLAYDVKEQSITEIDDEGQLPIPRNKLSKASPSGNVIYERKGGSLVFETRNKDKKVSIPMPKDATVYWLTDSKILVRQQMSLQILDIEKEVWADFITLEEPFTISVFQLQAQSNH